jgi:hypothetical protein
VSEGHHQQQDNRQTQLPAGLQVSMDRAIEARLERHLRQLDVRPRARRGTWATVILNLGLVGLGVGATAVTGALVPTPGVLVGLALEWAAIAAIGVSFSLDRSAVERLLPAPAPAPTLVAPPPAPAPAVPAPAAPADPADRLPLGVRVKVEQIRRKAEMLLEHQEHFPIGSRQLFVLRRIQAEYLPSTINVHQALSGDDRPVTPDGRTALKVLRDQLELLDSKLDEIAEDLQRENADRLLANERFLEEHFGHPPLGDPDLRIR